MSKVLIIAASDSGVPAMKGAEEILKQFGVGYELTISSAHRSPKRTLELVEDFQKNGGKVIICGAGLAAHLAGVVAAHFPLPVIGVPLKDKGGLEGLEGLDALLSTMQMPSGVPVATVGVDNAKNAGILAVQILAVSDKDLEKKIIDYKKELAQEVEEKAAKVEKYGEN